MSDPEAWRAQAPVDMVLHCPKCGKLHLDIGEFRTRVHRKHLCENTPEGPGTGCGQLFMPFLHATRGVSIAEALAKEIAALLQVARFRAPNEETTLQLEIADVLAKAGHTFTREAQLGPRERIDFLVGPIGIEVKIQGSASEVMRQLLRYAEYADVQVLILVTTRSQIVVPSELGGKPIFTVRHYAGL